MYLRTVGSCVTVMECKSAIQTIMSVLPASASAVTVLCSLRHWSIAPSQLPMCGMPVGCIPDMTTRCEAKAVDISTYSTQQQTTIFTHGTMKPCKTLRSIQKIKKTKSGHQNVSTKFHAPIVIRRT